MQASLFSPPGAWQAPAAPIASSPTLIGSALAGDHVRQRDQRKLRIVLQALGQSAEGERKVRAVQALRKLLSWSAEILV